MSLDNFQRITVETVRRHKGQISIMLVDGADKTAIGTAFADERLNKDIAIALQGYYQRQNAHHFDYRGLIPMGLALEAPEGMYKTE